MSEAQRKVIRASYAQMQAGQDPPYPTTGLAQLAEDIRIYAAQWKQAGTVHVDVAVDASGGVSSVRILEIPHQTLTRHVTDLLRKTRFTPAQCGPSACAMVFSLKFEIVRGKQPKPTS